MSLDLGLETSRWNAVDGLSPSLLAALLRLWYLYAAHAKRTKASTPTVTPMPMPALAPVLKLWSSSLTGGGNVDGGGEDKAIVDVVLCNEESEDVVSRSSFLVLI